VPDKITKFKYHVQCKFWVLMLASNAFPLSFRYFLSNLLW